MAFILIILLGITVGSFLNVVIARLGTHEGIGGRSHCPHCKHTLGFWDLVPLLSFLWLRGRCRYCRKPISWQYPIVELLTAALFILIFIVRYQSFPELRAPSSGPLTLTSELLSLISDLVFVATLIIISFYDARTLLIPDSLIVIALAAAIASTVLRGGLSSLSSGLLATAVFAGFFALLFFGSRGKWLGGGDVKLAVPIGIMVGWPTVFVTFLTAFWSGAVVGIFILLWRKPHSNSPNPSYSKRGEGSTPPLRVRGGREELRVSHEIPFGPFLALGAVVSLLWGEMLLNWYLAIFGI